MLRSKNSLAVCFPEVQLLDFPSREEERGAQFISRGLQLCNALADICHESIVVSKG